nr:adenosylhomocysteinase [Ardenticatenales bacterium]
VRALEASYAGWNIVPLEQAVAEADVIVTATGAARVLGEHFFPLLKEGVFLLNVGHRADEIDVLTLRTYPHKTVIPFVEAVQIGERTIYLFSGGSMANLTAGAGDSLNAFDVTLAVMTAGIGHIVGEGQDEAPGVYILPRRVWEAAIA